MQRQVKKKHLVRDRPQFQVACANCVDWLRDESNQAQDFALTFLDPPFNQGKTYRNHDDSMSDSAYWSFMSDVCANVFEQTIEGGCIYFMQREKNTEAVLRVLRETGWKFQNLIIWKKLTSAVPGRSRYGKAFQIIAFATKGSRPAAFNRLRISPKLPAGYKPHSNGIYVTDIWDDIRELTSGYFAGDEALRDKDGSRLHKQQSPVALLTRIILSSTMPGMRVLDPFAGSGTTSIVADQLRRESVAIEIDQTNCDVIESRLAKLRDSDSVDRFREDYCHTPNLDEIWPHVNPTQDCKTSSKSAKLSSAACSP